MTIRQMRAILRKLYKSERWAQKVNAMPDNQVFAVYHSFLERGEFEKAKQKKKAPKPAFKAYVGTQLSFDDILRERGEFL